jgi:acyl carrier protein
MNAQTAREDITLKVRRTIADTLRIRVEDVGIDARLDEEQLALDSLRLIKINVALEEEFDITLPDFAPLTPAKQPEIRSVRDVIELVSSKVNAASKENAQ